jgi:hypothetical protein
MGKAQHLTPETACQRHDGLHHIAPLPATASRSPVESSRVGSGGGLVAFDPGCCVRVRALEGGAYSFIATHHPSAPRAVPGHCVLTAAHVIPSRLPRFLAAASTGNLVYDLRPVVITGRSSAGR